MNVQWLEWPAPDNVHACFSLRCGGSSEAPYDSFNMGDHVGDAPVDVVANRQQLQHSTRAQNIAWLRQVHGTKVATLPLQDHSVNEYDASSTRRIGHACCVMTADCLPVFFCNRQGSQVAIAHAGWRGLLAGVLQTTLSTFITPEDVMVYLGPAISQQAFEVGSEVRSAYLQQHHTLAEFFLPSQRQGYWLANLYGIARHCLMQLGVVDIYGGDYCTYSDVKRFFSYRRDGVTGRMANLIWLT